VPETTYPEGLPVSERKDELVAAVRDNQVVIVAGETGSGKSTQLPKICLEAGQGVRGLIGHTQPRRIAARTIAERVAEELGGAVGEVVGYTVRFTDKVGDRTLVRVMTDGILLAEIQRDRSSAATTRSSSTRRTSAASTSTSSSATSSSCSPGAPT
jgi:ATP-dependent helicase HrpA